MGVAVAWLGARKPRQIQRNTILRKLIDKKTALASQDFFLKFTKATTRLARNPKNFKGTL